MKYEAGTVIFFSNREDAMEESLKFIAKYDLTTLDVKRVLRDTAVIVEAKREIEIP